MRVVDAGVVGSRHGTFIGNSGGSIEGSEWGSSSGSMSKCKEVLFQRGLCGSRGGVGE